jgi:hypothetical protein
MKTLANLYAAIILAVFLVLLAWGNAIAMFVVAAIALPLTLLLFKGAFKKPAVLIAMASCAMAALVAWALTQH